VWDTKPDKRIRRTFATPDPTAQNAFLCRTAGDRPTRPPDLAALLKRLVAIEGVAGI
jgi:hypothetical protein